MKLSDLYRQIIKLGKSRDPRTHSRVSYYEDTAVLYGDPDIDVRNIIVGIDIEVPELLLADRIRKTYDLDLVVSHHPEGKAYAALHEVMRLQVDVLQQAGVNRKIAEELLEERMREVERRILAQNHQRPVDAARVLDLPFMCVHTPADNHVAWFVKHLLDKAKPKKVEDIPDILVQEPEYKQAKKNLTGPRVIAGNPKREPGKILVEMTGGTEGPHRAYDKLYKAGVRTLVSMHLSEEHFKKVNDANLNVVIAGHISSDTLGLNLLLDRIEKEAKQILPTVDCSGFTRFRRN